MLVLNNSEIIDLSLPVIPDIEATQAGGEP